MSTKFCVITVCYNAADLLPVTIESVLAQDFSDYEYVIQDGNSTDDTPKIVASYSDRFKEKGITFKYNRESDNGIYDAMNKAAASCRAAYINFMNAGDCFYSEDVLKNVDQAVCAQSDPAPVIVFGDCAVYEYGRFYRFPKSLENIEMNMPFSHQSVFAANDFVQKHPFDTSYRYCADYDFLLKAHDEKVKFLDADTIVCITTADGVSSIKYHDTLMESAKMQRLHGIKHHDDAGIGSLERELRIKQFVLDHFPKFVKKSIRAYQIKKRRQNIKVIVPKWFESMV